MMKYFTQWQDSFRKKTKAQKIGYIVYRTIRFAVLLFCTYEIIMGITTGRPISNLFLYYLLLTAPAGVYRLISQRNVHKDNKQALKKHDRMMLKSVLLAIVIVTCILAATVLYAVYIE